MGSGRRWQRKQVVPNQPAATRWRSSALERADGAPAESLHREAQPNVSSGTKRQHDVAIIGAHDWDVLQGWVQGASQSEWTQHGVASSAQVLPRTGLE